MTHNPSPPAAKSAVTKRFVIVINLPDDSDAGSVADWFHGVVSRAYQGEIDFDPDPTVWVEDDFTADVGERGLRASLHDIPSA